MVPHLSHDQTLQLHRATYWKEFSKHYIYTKITLDLLKGVQKSLENTDQKFTITSWTYFNAKVDKDQSKLNYMVH